jgi:hypothetical protein
MATLELADGLAEAVLESGGQLQRRESAREVVPSGFSPLDALLPAGGVRRGSLVEWLTDDGGATGGGAVSLAFAVACRLAAPAGRHEGRCRHGTVVVVDRAGWFHPPAVLPWLEGRQLIVARPSRDEDELWAIDQSLRCRGVAAVLAWPRATAWGVAAAPSLGSRSPRHWTTAMRRWQLAARASGAVGLLVRSQAARGEPSWAEARISVASLPGGTLLERPLRLMATGGAWPGAAPDAERWSEVSIDLARGVAGSQRIAVGLRGVSPTRSDEGEALRAFVKGVAACRAS